MSERKFKLINFSELQTWYFVVALFSIISLWPIWSVRFPPMQDYPQHISQVQVLSEYGNPDYDYKDNFLANLKPAPYATFYAITLFFSKFLSIETAGKATISLYILLIFFLVLKVTRHSTGNSFPWGVLLFFPFAFNQQYFLGYLNYLLSLPILLLSLMDQKNLIKGEGWRRAAFIQVLWIVVLFFTHPFTFLLYISLSFINILLFCRRPDDFRRIIPHIFLSILLFSFWFFAANPTEFSTLPPEAKKFFWMPFNEILVYYTYIFTGMLWYDGPDWILIVLWISLASITVLSLFKHHNGEKDHLYECLIFFAITTIAIFILPFAKGVFTYINLRLTAVSYFFLALAVGKINFKCIPRVLFILLLFAILLHSVVKQRTISKEIEEIKPILVKIPSKSSILPLVFDNNSVELDSRFFDPHLHNQDYYFLLVGGGLSPYLPDSPLLPVHFKTAKKPTAPGDYMPHMFRWELHEAGYDYFLIRGPTKGVLSYISKKAVLLEKSGKWLLFKKKI